MTNLSISLLGQHFLQNLFGGLGDRPSEFPKKLPRPFDEQLPIITERDFQELQEQIPELAAYLETSSVSVCMKDKTGKESCLQMEELESLNATSQLQGLLERRTSDGVRDQKTASFVEMSSSEKATQMSLDASTKVEWSCEKEEKTAVQELQGNQFYSTIGIPVVSEVTNVGKDSVREETSQCADDDKTKVQKKSSSDSASEKSSGLDEDSDSVFRSAHEDYVTVFGADVAVNLNENDLRPDIQPVGVLQEDCTALLDDASQTTMLASSGSQSLTDHSTQTERSSDSNLLITESSLQESCGKGSLDAEIVERTGQPMVNEMVERLKHVEEKLRTTQESLGSASSQREKLHHVNVKVRDCFKQEFEVFRQCLNDCKKVLLDLEAKIKEDVLTAVASVQQKGDFYRENVSGVVSKRTRDEFEKELAQISSQFEQEKNVLEKVKSKLELEKSKLLEELKQYQTEKETTESLHKEEMQKLSLVLNEFKSKLDEHEGAAQKLQGSKSRYEEDQQIRFNAIMMKLKREKESALFQAQEKIKELTQCVQEKEESLKSVMVEKVKVTGEYEQAHGAFLAREQELLAGKI